MCYGIFSCQGVTDLFALLDVDGSGIITRTWEALRFCHGECESRRIYKYLYMCKKYISYTRYWKKALPNKPCFKVRNLLKALLLLGCDCKESLGQPRIHCESVTAMPRERERARIHYPAVHMRLSLPSQEHLFARNPGVCSSVIEDDSQDEGWCAPAMFELGCKNFWWTLTLLLL